MIAIVKVFFDASKQGVTTSSLIVAVRVDNGMIPIIDIIKKYTGWGDWITNTIVLAEIFGKDFHVVVDNCRSEIPVVVIETTPLIRRKLV